MSNTDDNIKFVSWNVRGIGRGVKSDRVMTHLQQLNGDIFFIQETHLRNREVPRLKRAWIGHLFHSKYNERARGTAILIRKKIQFEHHSTVSDPAGRFVIVAGMLRNVPTALVSVYGPNWDDPAFITKLFTSFPNIDRYHVIMGGDFNLVQDPDLDKSSSNTTPPTKSAKTLKAFADQLGLSDPWRRKSPTTKSFSFFSQVHHTYSRIDFFLLDNRLFPNVNACDYHSIAISDHAPSTLDLAFRVQFKPFRQWRFNSTLLTKDHYKNFLQFEIKSFID